MLRKIAAVIVLLGLVSIAFMMLSSGKAAQRLAFDDMNAAVSLVDGAGVVYTDSSTAYAGGKNAKNYGDIFRTGKMDAARAFIVNAETFDARLNKLASEKDATEAQRLIDEVLSKNVLRGMILTEGKKQTGYYYLMPTAVQDPMLITLFDKKGAVQKFRASYRDLVQMRSDLQPHWYMVMGLPDRTVDFSGLLGVENLQIHYMRSSQKMVSVAIIQVTADAVVEKVDKNLILVPILEGWK